MDNYLILLYSIAGLLFISLGVSIVFMVKLPKLLIVVTREAVDNILRGVVSTQMKKEVELKPEKSYKIEVNDKPEIKKKKEVEKPNLNVNYKFDYTKTKISNNKICHLAEGRCDEEVCYAFCFHEGIARCNEYFLEFTNYEDKEDR